MFISINFFEKQILLSPNFWTVVNIINNMIGQLYLWQDDIIHLKEILSFH